MLCMRNIICNLTFPSGLILDCYFVTFSGAIAYIILPQYRRLIGCDLDLECDTLSPLQLALISARQVMTKESSITGEDDVLEAAPTFVKAVE